MQRFGDADERERIFVDHDLDDLDDGTADDNDGIDDDDDDDGLLMAHGDARVQSMLIDRRPIGWQTPPSPPSGDGTFAESDDDSEPQLLRQLS